MGLGIVQELDMFQKAVATTVPKPAFGKKDKGEWFYSVQPDLTKTFLRDRSFDNLKKNQPPAPPVDLPMNMLYESAIQQNGSITFVFERNPTAACIGVFWIDQLRPVTGIYPGWQCQAAVFTFIPVGCEINTFGSRDESYCTHAFLYLIVDMATPKFAGSGTCETALTAIRSSAI